MSGIRSHYIVARVLEEVRALGRFESVEDFADGAPEPGDGALGGFAQVGLELGEGVLDRIEVRAIWRQVQECRACCLDHGTDARPLMTGEVVHDDDVAGPEFGHEHARDVGLEARPVDGSIDDERRDDAGSA